MEATTPEKISPLPMASSNGLINEGARAGQWLIRPRDITFMGDWQDIYPDQTGFSNLNSFNQLPFYVYSVLGGRRPNGFLGLS